MSETLDAGTEKASEPHDADEISSANDGVQSEPRSLRKVKWYRSTFYNAIILGICNFLSPGIWGAMNSLGGGGAAKPYLVNAANALTFSLMVVSCFFSPLVVHHTSIRFTLLLGTLGFAPYAAGLYTNNRYGTDWLLLLGAGLCGISAGLFWMAQMTIALTYPEPWNRGRFLGLWLSFFMGGQIVGGAVSLGINAGNAEKGKVSYTAYLVFIGLQILAPFVALLLTPPRKVERTDGVEVNLTIPKGNTAELRRIIKLLFSRNFALIVPLIAQGIYIEAVVFTVETFWFSVRGRALCSFLSGCIAILTGNLLGAYLDMSSISLKSRARWAFFITAAGQGALWIWTSVVSAKNEENRRSYDWTESGFISPFILFLLLIGWFQMQYLYLVFLVGHMSQSQAEVVRITGLLRGIESAVQAISYGVGSVKVMARSGNTYLNFGLWGIAIVPAWILVKEIGVTLGDRRMDKEAEEGPSEASS